MSPRGRGPFGRVGRRPDHWSTPHERARIRAAERLEAPLSVREATWLETHLSDCGPCREVADAYVADRLALRELRDARPQPPRDLWARTAASIERESTARRPAGSAPTGSAPNRRRATSLPALGALSGLAIVAMVVVAAAISGGFLGRFGRDVVGPSASIALASEAIAQPTAIAVGVGRVNWLGARDDGAFAYNVADINAVCPRDRQPDCAPFADANAKRVTLSATPRFVFRSPVNDQAVVVGTDLKGGDAVLIVALPTPDPTHDISPGSSSQASTGPVDSPGSTLSATPGPTPSTLVSTAPTDLPTVSPTEVASATLASTVPTASGVAPEPSAPVAVSIISDVTVVGRAAAYSPDGAWFAFSARPADGTAGPDIYAWHAGELQARAVTTDHASVFASWVGGLLLGSGLAEEPVGDAGQSPSPDTSPATSAAERVPTTFLLDPGTGVEIARLDAEWQPAVDPTGLAVVAWQGSVGIGGDGLTAVPATGNLVIHPFHGPLASVEPSAPPEASTPDSPSPSPSPSLSPSPSVDGSTGVSPSASPQVLRDFPTQVVATGPIADFDARWDDTGSWLAIWIADPNDPALGRLSLLHFDSTTGLVDRPDGAPQDVTSLPGFSIGLGRLAWASPPGQGGEGSRIQIAAWTSDQVGAVESIPVDGAVVVQ